MSQKELYKAILNSDQPDNLKNVISILNKDKTLINQVNKDEEYLSPLAYAVMEGAAKSIPELIKFGANPNEEVKQGEFKGEHIVELAAERSDPAVARALVVSAPHVLQITDNAVRSADSHGDKETLAEICKVILSNPTKEQKERCKHATLRVKSEHNARFNEIDPARARPVAISQWHGQINDRRPGALRNRNGPFRLEGKHGLEGVHGGYSQPKRKTRAKRSRKGRGSRRTRR